MSVITWVVTPGGLSAADHERIRVLAAEKKWGAHGIARALGKHPGTVQWFMYREGIIAPEYRGLKPYRRGGRWVYPFTAEEDAFVQALRVQDFSCAKIAELCTKRFDHRRTAHTIHNRLVMLAARNDTDEEL